MLSLESWDDIVDFHVESSDDVETQFNMFFSKYKRVFDTSCPIIVKRECSNNTAMFTTCPEIVNLRRRLDILYIAKKRRPDLTEAYKVTKKTYDTAVENRKKEYIR